MSILITGGSGSLGNELVRQLQEKDKEQKIIVFSRGELLQYQMKQKYPEGGASGLRYFIGDVRDYDRLVSAFKGVDTVIHAAAMKHIDTCDYNPQECIKTNVMGSMNVVQACVEAGVKKCMLVSTDKAPESISTYGSSKFLAERLFIQSNTATGTKFSVCRYGNVLGSNGSFLKKWKEQAAAGKPITLTSDKMTRFFWSISAAANFLIERVDEMVGGEIFLGKMNKFKMIDIAEKISKNINIIGLRSAEKLYETLISATEVPYCYDCKTHYTVCPRSPEWDAGYKRPGKKVPDDFRLVSYD